MAPLPNPIQVSGKHNAVFDAYYKAIDPKGTGVIEAAVAAKFLKKSGLSDVVLSRIWDLSDQDGKGYLDKPGFFVSLKLVSLAQAGLTINMSNIFADTPNPPKVGDIPKPPPPQHQPNRMQSVPVAAAPVGDWSIRVVDRLKYEQLFESLKPVNGMISGNKVKGVLMDSKLPMETLGRIWDLADQDKDGNLDQHEFIVAMHLVYQALAKRAVPATLPVELQKKSHQPPKPPPPVAAPMPRAPSGEGFGDGGFVANFPTDIAPPPVPPLPAVQAVPRIPPAMVPTMPLISTEPLVPQPTADWVVTPADFNRFEALFRESDRDKDGLVSGLEVKNVFIQSGVPQNCLAVIWALCDTNQSGKLTLEQFALAMWMVERKRSGIEPPQVLAPNMIPPSLRGVLPGIDMAPQVVEQKPTYSNPELEMISKEIEELAKERRVLETDIAQKEADIRIKSGEVRSLQSELDTLAATLKQLENQKGEAQKRLDDLKAQKTDYDEAIRNVNVEVNLVRDQVTKIRDQCHKQEETITEQESDLNSKRSELQKLKDEEAALEKDSHANRQELESLTLQLQSTQLEISQVRSMVTQLLETQRQMTDALLLCKAAIDANDTNIVSEYSLKIEPDFYEARNVLEKKAESPKKAEDPFQGKDSAFNASSDTFDSNGFSSDPFASANGSKSAFDDSFSTGFDTSFSTAGFGRQDPFGGAAADPFGGQKSTAITPEPGKDDFGSDPFAALHAPTGVGQVLSPNAQKSGPPPRPESPSPALPPKKAKQPPPRPAPPRPNMGPSRPTQPDAFGTSPGGFADFADFDNKQPSQSQPSPFEAAFASSQRTITPVGSAATGTAPKDFSDDPFKDYRYEDPFSIKDPFADDDDDESSEAFFSDDSKKNTKNASILTLNNEPFPSAVISRLSPHIAATKSPRTTPIGALDNDFANFDAFATITTDNHNNNNSSFTQPKPKPSTTDFFDAFNDNFTNFDSLEKPAPKTTSAFDAFGDITAFSATSIPQKPSKSAFDDFNDNSFEDDFFKLQVGDKNTSTNGNFAAFDAFGDSALNNATSSSTSAQPKPKIGIINNHKTQNDGANKIADKFADDYSKTDSFDADLQEALKRSLADN